MRLTVLLCGLALTSMLTGCLTTSIVVIDAGCQTYERHQVRPSRLDTPETAKGLYVLSEAMGEACRKTAT